MEKESALVTTDIDSSYSTISPMRYGRIDFEILEVRIG